MDFKAECEMFQQGQAEIVMKLTQFTVKVKVKLMCINSFIFVKGK